MRERVVITGAAGKLGLAVLSAAPPDVDVIAVDRAMPKGWDGACRFADVREVATLREAFADGTSVIHLAAIPGPRMVTDSELFDINVTGTFNVGLVAEERAMRRLVFASSLNWYGYPFSRVERCPPSLPLREDAGTIADEPYSLSKRLGEEIVAAWARRVEGAAVSLRYPWITTEWTQGLLPLPGDNPAHRRHFYCWLSDRDCAVATWQAWAHTAEMPPRSHEAYNLSADCQSSDTPTRELLAMHYPDAANAFGDQLDDNPYATLYDATAARRAFGFSPTPAAWHEA